MNDCTHQSQAHKYGLDGKTLFLVCCDCGATIGVGTSEAPKSTQKPLDVSDEKALWDRVQENRAIAARED
jgi:hypothetical protein